MTGGRNFAVTQRRVFERVSAKARSSPFAIPNMSVSRLLHLDIVRLLISVQGSFHAVAIQCYHHYAMPPSCIQFSTVICPAIHLKHLMLLIHSSKAGLKEATELMEAHQLLPPRCGSVIPPAPACL